MKKLIIILWLFIFIHISFSAVTNARIFDSSGNTANVYYETGTTGQHVYIDRATADVGIEICGDNAADVQNKYIGALYAVAINNSTVFNYTLVTKYTQTPSPYHALVQTGTAYTKGAQFCANASLPDISFMDSLVDDEYGVNTSLSAYPAYLWIVISDDAIVEQTDSFVYLSNTNGYLPGSFNLNNYQSTYDQTTGNINVDITGVTVYIDPSTSQPMDSNYQDRKYAVEGVCTDNKGENCTSSTFTSLSDGAVSLFTGVVLPDDQHIHQRYVMTNGIPHSLCIGPDVRVQSLSISPSSTVYYGDNVTITTTITNNNNVNITTDFNVSLYIDGVYINSTIVTDTLAPGATKTISWNWTANKTSGSYQVLIAADSNNNITECDESASSNNRTTTLNINALNFLHFFIDDVENRTFPYVGRPYNITIILNDSDGNTINNATIEIYEVNGVNLLGPLQNWTDAYGKTGLISINKLKIRTNSSGAVSFAMTPTGNKLLLDPSYASNNISSYVGNYSLYAKVKQGNSYLEFMINGSNTETIPLSIKNHTMMAGNKKHIHHRDSFFMDIDDYVYKIYSLVRKVLV